jgi:hypothetical protein
LAAGRLALLRHLPPASFAATTDAGRKDTDRVREYYDRIICDEEEFWEKVYYIVSNPQRRWPNVTEYAWAEWFPFE